MSTLGHKLSVIDANYDSNRPCYEENCSLDEEDNEEDQTLLENRDNSTVLVNTNDNKITEQLIKGNTIG